MNIKIESVEEMFRWKLSEKILNQYGLKKLYYKSVEDVNRSLTESLNWPKELDVLYSFLLVYKLGLITINENRFLEIKEEMKKEWNIKLINTNSKEFLFRCSKDDAYKEFNNCNEITDFLKMYFSIGNVIPIWPGGNEARGKSGLYDIPELFFNRYSVWTNVLIKHYETAYLDDVLKGNYFIFSKDEFKDIKNFVTRIKKDNQVYFDYLASRSKVIREREKLLLNYLGKTVELN